LTETPSEYLIWC